MPKEQMRLALIDAPHFSAAVVVGERAPPIVRYMRDWDEQRVRAYCELKRWRVEFRDMEEHK